MHKFEIRVKSLKFLNEVLPPESITDKEKEAEYLLNMEWSLRETDIRLKKYFLTLHNGLIVL